MKKLISILISVCLILTAVAPSVFAYEPTTISVSNQIQDNGTYLVTVKGSAEANNIVSITVIHRDGSGFAALEQCMANSSGIYTKTFPIRNAGEYTAIANNYTSNSKATTDFRLYSVLELNNAVDEFKKASSTDAMKLCITTYGSIFGFDTKFYTAEAENAVADKMISMRSSLTKENIVEKFDEANLRAYIYELGTNIDGVIEYYDNLVSIAGSDVGMYADYKALEDSAKARVQNIAFKTPVTDIKDLCEKFHMAIVEEKLTKGTITQFDNFVSNYVDYLGLEGYANIPTSTKSKLLNALKTKEVPDNTEDFAKLYKDILDDVKAESGTKPPATGGSGGGGGGGGGAVSGGGSVVTDAKGYETTEVLNTPTPDVTVDITFADLEGYSWATDAITYLAQKGIITGRDEDTFAPADNITREEYAKIIVLAFGLYSDDATCQFTDVASDRWSYKYIASIYGYGAITGYPDGTFGASKPITREEMAVILYRVMSKQMRIEINTEVKTTLKDYSDIAEFAKPSVMTLNYNGIISGDNMGNFNPKNNANRAEVCKMIYNSLNTEGGRK